MMVLNDRPALFQACDRALMARKKNGSVFAAAVWPE